MAIAGIPEVIHDFNLYTSGNKLLGLTNGITYFHEHICRSLRSTYYIINRTFNLQKLFTDCLRLST